MLNLKSLSHVMLMPALCFGASGALADPVIQDFNNTEMGVAFTMLSQNDWEHPGGQHFHATPTDGQKVVQAVTISNAGKQIWPYPADSRYGLIFDISEESHFYRYFATKSSFTSVCDAGKGTMTQTITDKPASNYSDINHWAVSCGGTEQITFCGRCADGGACAGSGTPPDTQNGLWPALGTQVPYGQFITAKNAIVAATGTASCTWNKTANAWNEFDTNGLSPKALRGVMIDGITPGNDRNWAPTDETLCGYLTKANPRVPQWPVYKLVKAGNGSALQLVKKVQCLSAG